MLLVVDGNNLAYRVKYTHDLTHPITKEDVSVSYGVLRVLWSLLNKFGDAKSVVVAWDGGIPEYRRKAVPEYKAARHENDDPYEREIFYKQMNWLHSVLPSFGVLSVKRSGCEADDIMYHAAVLYDGDAMIVSSDKDMLQTLSDTVNVYRPSADKIVDAETLELEAGIKVEQYVEWRAIQGDGSDNIPGVVGIGPKTATKLFQDWGTVEKIIEAAENGDLTDAKAAAILEFGYDRIVNNIRAMRLDVDLSGAKQALLEHLGYYSRAKPKEFAQHLKAQAFVSLWTESDFKKSMMKLVKPKFNLTGVRIPTVLVRRIPVGKVTKE